MELRGKSESWSRMVLVWLFGNWALLQVYQVGWGGHAKYFGWISAVFVGGLRFMGVFGGLTGPARRVGGGGEFCRRVLGANCARSALFSAHGGGWICGGSEEGNLVVAPAGSLRSTTQESSEDRGPVLRQGGGVCDATDLPRPLA